jgi:hypothetical protein
MRERRTRRLLAHILPALVLCLLAALFASEAKLVKYVHADGTGGEVHAGKLYRAEQPSLSLCEAVRIRVGSKVISCTSALLLLVAPLVLFWGVLQVEPYPARVLGRSLSALSPSVYLRPPPLF